MNRPLHFRIRVRYPRISAFCCVAFLASAGARGQNEMFYDRPSSTPIPVERAIPVLPTEPADPSRTPMPVRTPIPIAPAIPVEQDTDSAPGAIPRPIQALTPIPVRTPGRFVPAPAATPLEPRGTSEPPLEGTPEPKVTSTPRMTAKTFADVQLEIANNFYARKDYEHAAPAFEKYLGLYQDAPERETALFRVGESYRALGELIAAQNAYRALLARYRRGKFVGSAAYRLGEIDFRRKEFREALGMFQLAHSSTQSPDLKAASRFYQARSMEKLGRRLEARGIYEQVVEGTDENPFREASLLALAQLLADTRRPEEAVKRFKELAKFTKRPELKAEATVRAALIEIDLDRIDEAEAELQAALEMPMIGKWEEVARVGLIRVLYAKGKYEELLDRFTGPKASFTDETRPEVLLMAANAYRQLGKPAQAQQLYDAIVYEYPASKFADDAKYERLVAMYNAESPELIAAASDYLDLNSGSENSARVALLKAETLFKQKKYDESVGAYEQIDLSRLPEDLRANAMFKLGWAQMHNGQLDEAIKSLSAFLDKYSDHQLASYALAQRAIAHQRKKQFDEALNDFTQLIDDFPKARERELALQQKALILGQKEDNAGMASAFELLLKDYPDSAAAAQANFWIGWGAFAEKNYRKAIKYLPKAIELDKEEEFRDRAYLRIILSNYYLNNPKKVAEAVDAFNETDTQQQVPIEIFRWLGMENLKQGNYAAAKKYLAPLVNEEMGAEADVNDALNLGRAQSALGEFEPAIASFDKYLAKVDRPFPRATGLLEKGRAQLDLSQLDEADNSVDEALTLQPEGRLNAEGRMLKGSISLARNDYGAAARMLQSVSVMYEDPELTPQALDKAWQAYEKAGEPEKAKEALNYLQTRYPEYWQKKIQEDKTQE